MVSVFFQAGRNLSFMRFKLLFLLIGKGHLIALEKELDLPVNERLVLANIGINILY